MLSRKPGCFPPPPPQTLPSYLNYIQGLSLSLTVLAQGSNNNQQFLLHLVNINTGSFWLWKIWSQGFSSCWLVTYDTNGQARYFTEKLSFFKKKKNCRIISHWMWITSLVFLGWAQQNANGHKKFSYLKNTNWISWGSTSNPFEMRASQKTLKHIIQIQCHPILWD